jgi:hypothetical protein
MDRYEILDAVVREFGDLSEGEFWMKRPRG